MTATPHRWPRVIFVHQERQVRQLVLRERHIRPEIVPWLCNQRIRRRRVRPINGVGPIDEGATRPIIVVLFVDR